MMQQPISAEQLEPIPPSGREKMAHTPRVEATPSLSWLTVEMAAYLGLALLALALRLTNLGVVPLSDAEAAQALVAWRVYHNQPVNQVGYSPLIATLNLAGFVLFGGSDFVARLAPALLGVALVLLPSGLRRYLGRGGALIAASLFAISPTAVYFSRTVNGDIGAAVGGLALTVGFFGWLDWEANWRSSRLAWLILAGAGVLLLLTASSSAYSILVLLLGLLVLVAVVGDKRYTASTGEGLAALRGGLVSWGSFGLLMVIGLLVVATGLLFNPDGMGAAADLLTAWLRGFVPGAAPGGAYPAIFLLTLYEIFIVLAGIFGLSVSLMRRRLLDLWLAWWFLGGIVLNLLRSGRVQGEVLVPLVPLTLLAGLALGMLWESLHEEGSWQREGILFMTGLVIGGYAYVSLMIYTRSGGMTFWLPVAGVGLFLGLVVLFGLWYDAVSALRGAALVAAALLLVLTVATGARLNNQRAADPRQLLVRTPAGEGLPDLVSTLERLSSWRAGDAHLINIVADRRLGPAVEWALRRFQNVSWVDRLDSWPPVASSELSDAPPEEAYELSASTVLLTPADDSLSLDEGFVGQDFAIRAFWSPAGLSGQSLIRWMLLRTATTPVSFERAVLWVEGPPLPPEEMEDQTRTPGVSIQ